MLKPDKLDSATTLKGLHYIDVPGQSKKDYKVDFHAHKEGTFNAKVCYVFLKCSSLHYRYIMTTLAYLCYVLFV